MKKKLPDNNIEILENDGIEWYPLQPEQTGLPMVIYIGRNKKGNNLPPRILVQKNITKKKPPKI